MIKKLLLFFFLFNVVINLYAQSPTDPALAFNVFVANNATLTSGETEGPIALGGNLTIGGNYEVSNSQSGFFNVSGIPTTLVIGGNVNYSNGILTVGQQGYVQIGDCSGSTIWYTDMSDYYSPMHITPGSDYNGAPRIDLQVLSDSIHVDAATNPVCQPYMIDFNSAFVQMKYHATCMSNLTDNANLTNASGGAIAHTGLPSAVHINLNAGVNVLNISGTDLNAVTNFTYNTVPDAGHILIINVNAPASFTWQVFTSTNITLTGAQYVLYNFYNTTSLNIAGSAAVEGTIYAPFADITKNINIANVEGQIIGQSYIHGAGEDHYAVFSGNPSSCTGAVPTTCSFTVNDTIQCEEGNYFVFVSSISGTAPFSYYWTFGDGTSSTSGYPTKTYTTTGTYTVKLVVTGAGGADSMTQNVMVGVTPANGFTVNDTVQALTGNSFVFTSNSYSTTYSYNWDFGDGTTSTAANPVKSYSATGTYIVHQRVKGPSGCTTCVCVHQAVYVICDSVSSGGGGGLESQSLGDLVSRRMINIIKNSINTKQDYNNLPVFSKNNPDARGTGNTDRLKQFIPASLDANTTGYVTTPSDITSLTAAVDVFSVDYVNNNNAKAVVLGITTTGSAYNHTKSICDRFRGAILLGTSIVQLQGFKFIQFQLQQQTGEMEYCIAFAAGKSLGSSNFHLQSKWLISEYTGDDSVFNFQVWAASPVNAQKLANSILTNLASVMPLQQTDVNFILPPAYIASGKRNKGFLDLTITNTTNSKNGRIIFEERRNEFAGIDTLAIPFTLTNGSSNTFHIPIYDGYEYEGHLYLNDTLTDDVYMADGNWSIDYDKTQTKLTYRPDNDYGRIYTDGEYPLYRNITVNATSADYISIYKFVTSGEDPVDMRPYHSYKFLAQGYAGKVQIRLIKKSVVKWADQYYATINLDSAVTNYQVSFDNFVSDNLITPFDPKDVTAVVYTFIFNGVSTNFNFFADDQAFSPTVVPGTRTWSSKKIIVSPNPSNGQFACMFESDKERDMTLVLTDISGNTVLKQPVHAVTGFNTVNVTLPAAMPPSVLVLKMGGSGVKYDVTKINILH